MCHVHCTVNTGTIITCDRCRGRIVLEVCDKQASRTGRVEEEKKNDNYNTRTRAELFCR